MSWEILSGTAAKILKYSTPFGHAWNLGTFMFRLLPATTIGEAVYGDEIGDFECLTTQPGCQKMCWNQFSPMTHTRFWCMHILILSFPPIVFAFIAANFNAQFQIIKNRVENSLQATPIDNNSTRGSVTSKTNSYNSSAYHGSTQYYKDLSLYQKVKTKQRKNINPDEEGEITEVLWAPSMRRWYVVTIFVKLVLEILGLYCWYILQIKQNPGKPFLEVWTVPHRYMCTYGSQYTNWACSQEKEIPCWVPRPWERQIFLHYMLFVHLLSIILIILDLLYVIQKVTTKRLRKRRERKKLLPSDDQVSLFSEKNRIDE